MCIDASRLGDGVFLVPVGGSTVVCHPAVESWGDDVTSTRGSPAKFVSNEEDCAGAALVFLATHVKRAGMDCTMIRKDTVARLFSIQTNKPLKHVQETGRILVDLKCLKLPIISRPIQSMCQGREILVGSSGRSNGLFGMNWPSWAVSLQGMYPRLRRRVPRKATQSWGVSHRPCGMVTESQICVLIHRKAHLGSPGGMEMRHPRTGEPLTRRLAAEHGSRPRSA